MVYCPHYLMLSAHSRNLPQNTHRLSKVRKVQFISLHLFIMIPHHVKSNHSLLFLSISMWPLFVLTFLSRCVCVDQCDRQWISFKFRHFFFITSFVSHQVRNCINWIIWKIYLKLSIIFIDVVLKMHIFDLVHLLATCWDENA